MQELQNRSFLNFSSLGNFRDDEMLAFYICFYVPNGWESHKLTDPHFTDFPATWQLATRWPDGYVPGWLSKWLASSCRVSNYKRYYRKEKNKFTFFVPKFGAILPRNKISTEWKYSLVVSLGAVGANLKKCFYFSELVHS